MHCPGRETKKARLAWSSQDPEEFTPSPPACKAPPDTQCVTPAKDKGLVRKNASESLPCGVADNDPEKPSMISDTIGETWPKTQNPSSSSHDETYQETQAQSPTHSTASSHWKLDSGETDNSAEQLSLVAACGSAEVGESPIPESPTLPLGAGDESPPSTEQDPGDPKNTIDDGSEKTGVPQHKAEASANSKVEAKATAKAEAKKAADKAKRTKKAPKAKAKAKAKVKAKTKTTKQTTQKEKAAL